MDKPTYPFILDVSGHPDKVRLVGSNGVAILDIPSDIPPTRQETFAVLARTMYQQGRADGIAEGRAQVQNDVQVALGLKE